jgi:hypothetical protein
LIEQARQRIGTERDHLCQRSRFGRSEAAHRDPQQIGGDLLLVWLS